MKNGTIRIKSLEQIVIHLKPIKIVKLHIISQGKKGEIEKKAGRKIL